MQTFKRSILSLLGGFYLVAGAVVVASMSSVSAAGVTVYVEGSSDGYQLPLNTATDINITYTSSAPYAIDDTIYIRVPAAGVTLAQCTTHDDDADSAGGSPDGAFGIVGNLATYTFTSASAGTTIDLCLGMTATVEGNYGVNMYDNKAVPTNNDYGAVLLYSGTTGSTYMNDVTVTANVSPTLAFAIRTAADDANTNVCELGSLTLTDVNTCSYRLKITTNAVSGYTIDVATDGDLSKNGTGDVADADDIDLIAEDGTVTAGTEGYGIAFNGGAITSGGLVTEEGNFADDDTPLPVAATLMLTADDTNAPTTPDTTNTSLVTHRAAMDAGTATGNYSQVVTYTVAAQF